MGYEKVNERRYGLRPSEEFNKAMNTFLPPLEFVNSNRLDSFNDPTKLRATTNAFIISIQFEQALKAFGINSVTN